MRQRQCKRPRPFIKAIAAVLCGWVTTSGATGALDPDDLAAAFAAAGFERAADGRYVRCRENPPTLSYQPGQAELADLNGDGQPELWITEGSVFCYGNAGNAFVLLTRDGSGWRVLLDQVGIQVVSETRHGDWPDIEVGGPGFGPFPLYRWDGSGYTPTR